jgi:hypothetical protein
MLQHRCPALVLTLACALSLLCLPLKAQSQATTQNPDDWMVEVRGPNVPPDFLPFSRGSHTASTSFGTSAWCTEAQIAEHAQPSLKLVYWLEGDVAKVSIALQYPATAGAGSPPQQVSDTPVGTYTLKADDPLTLSDLLRFGLPALELTLVTARDPGSTLPPIVNNTSSLTVEREDEDRETYKLTVRNNSYLVAQAVTVSSVGADGSSTDTTAGMGMEPVIMPGASHELWVSKGDASTVQQIIVDAVVFKDGTYEGSDLSAAILLATYTGRQRQKQRIQALIREQLENPDAADGADLELVRARVKSLPSTPDRDLADSVLQKFPGLTGAQRERVETAAKSGYQMEKSMFLNHLARYVEEKSKPQAADSSLEQWWESYTNDQESATAPTLLPPH